MFLFPFIFIFTFAIMSFGELARVQFSLNLLGGDFEMRGEGKLNGKGGRIWNIEGGKIEWLFKVLKI